MGSATLLGGTKIRAEVLSKRIAHLRDVVALITDMIADHKSPDAFQGLVDLALRSCEIEPVVLAKAFEVNTGTISRWRSGKNAPHPSVRPYVIDWIKKHISDNVSSLSEELQKLHDEAKVPPTEEISANIGRKRAGARR